MNNRPQHYWLQIVFGLTALFALAPITYADFSDVRYHCVPDPDGTCYVSQYASGIRFLEQQGIMTGNPDGTFKPGASVNRAELMKILVTAAQQHPSAEEFSHCFPDVQTQWFAPYVCYAKDHGWIQGYPDGNFHPDKTVNFAETFKMLAQSRGYEPLKPTRRGYDMHAWFAPYVEALFDKGVIHDDAIHGDRPAILASSIIRERIAEFLYKTFLTERKVSFDFSKEAQCPTKGFDRIKLTSATGPVTVSRLYAINTKAGQSCLVTDLFSPFFHISPAESAWFSTYGWREEPIETDATGTEFYSYSVEVGWGGVVGFHSEMGNTAHNLKVPQPDNWEFDLTTQVLRQVPNQQ